MREQCSVCLAQPTQLSATFITDLGAEEPTPRTTGGEGGIRTLGALLGHGALAKRCFQPLSHLTKNRLREYREELPVANISVMPVISSGDAIVDIQNVPENVDRETTQRDGNVAQDSIHSER